MRRVRRTLEIGWYQTAWAMLHRLRSVLVRPGRERLTGRVEVDETFIGGEEPGLRCGRQNSKKSLVGVAVEVHEPKGFGRCRMEILPDASAASLHPFVTDHTEAKTTVVTDGWQGYSGIDDLGYVRERHSQRAARRRGEDPHALLPGVHRIASLAARHLPRIGGRGASAGAPRRVRVPLQPSHLAQPRACVPARSRARRRPSAGALPGPRGGPTTQAEAACRARLLRSSAICGIWANDKVARRAPPVRRRWHQRCLPIFTETAIFTGAMNMPTLLNIAGALEPDALRILREVPGVKAEPAPATKRRSDIIIRAGDVTHVVEVKAQRVTNAAAARQLAEYARNLAEGTHLILIARTTTEEARHLLEEAGVGVIDTLGNMRVALPGLFLWTEGRPAPAGRDVQGEPPAKLTGKAGVATQALLRAPERYWKVHDLAREADVSVGLAHRVFTRLEREQLVQAEGAGPRRTRRVTNPTALLDLWAEEMRDRNVKQLRAFRLARDPRAQTKTLSRLLAAADIEHAVTGPAGAARLAPFITAIPVTDIWIADTAALDDVAAAAAADVVQEGHNIVLRQAAGDMPLAFHQQVDGVWTANPFRLFFDLRQDPRRGREQAEQLRKEVIGF